MFIYFSPSIIGFKAPATPIMEGIIDLHNYIFIYLILVFIVVLWMYCYILFSFYIIPTFLYDLSVAGDHYFHNNFTFYCYRVMIRFLVYVFVKKEILIELDAELNSGINKKTLKPFTFFEYYEKAALNLTAHNKIENELLKDLLSGFFLKANLRHADILETRKITEHTLIEIIWTIIPSIILILIAVPSFALLYAMDEIIDPKLTVKAIGYQWFWSYEYAHAYDYIDFNYKTDNLGYNLRVFRDALIYDSVMLTESELIIGYHRLLEVDRQLILPVRTHIRLMITGADVIHSWAVPSFGIKVDAVPGRMSQIGVFIKYEGVFYGQCSELCGVNHGFMPIVVKVIGYDKFLMWYRNVEIIWNE